ncbi:MAG: hypothetical protein ACO1OB_34075 [Archangium sp.]
MKLLWPVGAALTWFFVRPHFGLIGSVLLSLAGAVGTQVAALFIVAGVSWIRERLRGPHI